MDKQNELKQKAVDYLIEAFGKPKQADEFDIYELQLLFPKLDRRVIHYKMQELVEKGTWESRTTYVEEHQRRMRLWRLKG